MAVKKQRLIDKLKRVLKHPMTTAEIHKQTGASVIVIGRCIADNNELFIKSTRYSTGGYGRVATYMFDKEERYLIARSNRLMFFSITRNMGELAC